MTAPEAKVLEIHGVTAQALKAWADKLPKGQRPSWISARAAGAALFDAVAAADPDSRDWTLVFRDYSDGKPYEELTKTHRVAALASYRDGEAFGNFILGVADGQEWEYWFGGADFITEKIADGLKFDRVRDGVKERWLPNALSAHKYGDGTVYELVAAWLPDRACRWHAALTAGELAAKVTQSRKQGWRPHIVNVHANQDDVKFVAVFFENTAGEPWDFTPSLSPGDYEGQLRARLLKGQRPRCVSSHVADGKVLYTVVWDGVNPPKK